MRFKDYLREVKMTVGDADKWLFSQNTALFMWSREDGLIWWDPKTRNIYQRNKKVSEWKGRSTPVHCDLYEIVSGKQHIGSAQISHFIRGRVSPTGNKIIIHDTRRRGHTATLKKQFDYYVDKTMDVVYKYMGSVIK